MSNCFSRNKKAWCCCHSEEWYAILRWRANHIAKFGSTELTRTVELTIEGPAFQLGFIRVTFANSAAVLSTQSAVRLPLAPDNWLTACNSDLQISSSLSVMSSWNSVFAILASASLFLFPPANFSNWSLLCSLLMRYCSSYCSLENFLLCSKWFCS